jgi:hypothetical protein
MTSNEFNLSRRFIAGLYVGLLVRDAEFRGWQFQRGALSSGGVSQDALVTNFLASSEYNRKFPNTSNEEFIRLLYRYVLRREASQTEVAAWVRELTKPGSSRARYYTEADGAGPR